MPRRPGARDEGGNRVAPRAADAALIQLDAVTGFATRAECVADSTYVVSVRGEIDLSTGPAFSTVLHGALDAGATRLIVDLSGCGFMDSTGISILVGASRRLGRSRNGVAVVTGQPNVLAVLQITAVDDVVRVYRSRSEALDAGD